jgi:hypothetical protein
MNGVAVAWNGLRLWENEATGSKKVFRGFRGLWDTIKHAKMVAKVRECRDTVN